MIANNLHVLVNKLDLDSKKITELATKLCYDRKHSHVEITHLLFALLTDDGIIDLLKQFDINLDCLTDDINYALPREHVRKQVTPSFSSELLLCLQQAWTIASIEYDTTQITPAILFVALFCCHQTSHLAYHVSKEFYKINLSKFKQFILNAMSSQLHDNHQTQDKQTELLDQYSVDLVAKARAGSIEPVYEREKEIDAICNVLARKKRNNPLLVGEAGVGKTAIVEGLALRIANQQAPKILQQTVIRCLDLNALQAGASLKGEYEKRIQAFVCGVQQASTPIILFIDEAHILLGNSDKEGQAVFANYLKPALARGELCIIAATTWAEYKSIFSKDSALDRRFQCIHIAEPDTQQTLNMLRPYAKKLASHHHVSIREDALLASVTLAERYLHDSQLPDKAFNLLDSAAAKVALAHQQPAIQIATYEKGLAHIQAAIDDLSLEEKLDIKHREALRKLSIKQKDMRENLTRLNKQFIQEKKLISDIHQIEKKLQQGKKDNVFIKQLRICRKKLAQVQTDNALLSVAVDAYDIAVMVTQMTGIPVGKILKNEYQMILNLASHLEKRVIGQQHALKRVTQTIQIARAQIGNQNTPLGIFLLAGTSGTGKTETALALADLLYPDKQNLTIINMSEYKEKHKVATLIGSPPGYVGYGKGGCLTNAVRQHPFSVILLDEIEKADPSIQDLFYQVFDKGMLTDSEGQLVDFKQTIIMMTTNVGSQSIMQAYQQSEIQPLQAIDSLADYMRDELLTVFKPAFLGRVEVIPYLPLGEDQIKQITRLKLQQLTMLIQQQYHAILTYDELVVSSISKNCEQIEIGARAIQHEMDKTILPILAQQCLHYTSQNKAIKSIHLGVNDNGVFASINNPTRSSLTLKH